MMGRSLLLADVHGNLRALEAVLNDAASHGGFDRILMLGDLVGYGPEPDECVELLREHPLIAVAGNHDLGAAGRADLGRFNPDAAIACEWCSRRLSISSLRFLEDLPLRHVEAGLLLVHGSPRDPIWEYMVSPYIAAQNLAHCAEKHCLVGHTHQPAIYSMTGSSVEVVSSSVALDGRLAVNPGSVGQPRDGDPRAAYAMLDIARNVVTFHRVVYDVGATADAIVHQGLPRSLAQRLHTGY